MLTAFVCQDAKHVSNILLEYFQSSIYSDWHPFPIDLSITCHR